MMSSFCILKRPTLETVITDLYRAVLVEYPSSCAKDIDQCFKMIHVGIMLQGEGARKPRQKQGVTEFKRLFDSNRVASGQGGRR